MISIFLHFFFILFLQFYVTDLSPTGVKNGALRIIGGRNATNGEFPYVIRLELQETMRNGTEDLVSYRFKCTCSLVKPTWSLTAAHCLIDEINLQTSSSKKRRVLRYDLNTRETGTSIILSVVQHPNYYSQETKYEYAFLFNDIGLVQSEEVPITQYAMISSIDYTSLLGHQVLDLGYGLTIGPDGMYGTALQLNKSLQVLDVIVTKCPHLETYYHARAKPSFCTMGPCGRWSTAAFGDSGGPILHPSGIVGVLTGGDIRNLVEKSAMLTKLYTFAGVITPTSPFIDWIAKTIT